MSSNEKSSKHLEAAFPTLQNDNIPSSSSSIQSGQAEQQFGDDVEKSIPLDDDDDDDIEKANPSYSDKNRAHASSGPDPNACPDGGFQAWLAVAGGFCTVFASFGWINCKNNVLRALIFHI
jgi:hypothetical protein